MNRLLFILTALFSLSVFSGTYDYQDGSYSYKYLGSERPGEGWRHEFVNKNGNVFVSDGTYSYDSAIGVSSAQVLHQYRDTEGKMYYSNVRWSSLGGPRIYPRDVGGPNPVRLGIEANMRGIRGLYYFTRSQIERAREIQLKSHHTN